MICALFFSCSQTGYRDGKIQYEKVQLNPEEKQIVSDALKGMHEKYDPEGKMLTYTINGYNYHQVRFMHDNYDFSAATFYGQQNEDQVLAVINFISNGGDKHISIDRFKDGKITAKDLRLRFEFGNVKSPDELAVPKSVNDPFVINLDELEFNFQLYCSEFDGAKGHWEKGGDGKTSWIDFVFYSGKEKEIDLIKMNRAVSGFIFELNSTEVKQEFKKADVSEKEGILKIEWNGLTLETPVKPQAPKYNFI